MSDLPKGVNQGDSKETTSGQIFSKEEKSAYEQAASIVSEASTSQEDLAQKETQLGNIPVASQSQQVTEVAGYPASSVSSSPPTGLPPNTSPPFIENKRKKYLVFGIIVVFILLVVVLVFKLISRKPAEKPPEKNKVTLTYWGLWEEEEVLRPLIDDYQRLHKNITIKYIRQDPKQYREILQARIEQGEGPDIFRFHNTWMPMMINYLSPVPKNIYIDDDFEKIFYPVVTQDLKVRGNYYGIPLEIDGLLLFYNEEILKSANVSVPSTWIEVLNSVQKLTVEEKGRIITSAVALGTSENVEHFSDILGLMMLQNGTNLSKSLFSCADETSSNCAIETLSFYRRFVEVPTNTWDDTLENSIIAFAGGKVAMIIAPSWEAFTIKQISPNFNFKTAPVPQLPCQKQPCPSVNWATYWVEGVSNKSKNQTFAWDFLKFLSQRDSMQKLYSEQVKIRKLFGEPYSRVDLGKLLLDNSYLAPLINSAPTMKSFYLASKTYDGETGINTIMTNYLKDAVNSLSSGVSPETALKTVDSGFQQVFSRFGITSAQ